MATKPRFFGWFSAKTRSVLRNRQGIPRGSREFLRARMREKRADEARCRDGGRTRFQPEPGFHKRAPIPCSSPRVSARASLSLLVNLANIVAYVVARIVLAQLSRQAS